MRVPAYLIRSRHGIFYFRWLLPQWLHPKGKASDIKVSLRTRDPREALRMSRYLGYVADTLIERAVVGHAQEGVTQQHYFREGYTLRQLSDAMELFTAD